MPPLQSALVAAGWLALVSAYFWRLRVRRVAHVDATVRKPAGKVGDRILFGKYNGTEVTVDGEEGLTISEDDIIAILEK